MSTNWRKNLGKVIAVASGKGGVGKSTVAANLACALSEAGHRVGILDADIYGPSQHIMMGLKGQNPVLNDEKKILPIEKHGLYVMSFGFFVKPDQAVIWRGPMIARMLQQFFQDVLWPELDYLVVDLPPGTGDIQLSLSQLLKLTGAAIVTTPQDIALADAIKGIQMFQKVEVDILGLIENMSHFVCPSCSHSSPIFSEHGAKNQATELGVSYLGDLPLEQATREYADQGNPIVISEPKSDQAMKFKAIAQQIHEKATEIVSKNPQILEPVEKEGEGQHQTPFKV